MRRTILLADDSVTIRKIVELTLQRERHPRRVGGLGTGGARALARPAAGPRARGRRHARALRATRSVAPIKASDRPDPGRCCSRGTFEPFDAVRRERAEATGTSRSRSIRVSSSERVEQLLARGAAPRASAERRRSFAVDDLDAMFDDLAAPEHPEPIDARPATYAARRRRPSRIGPHVAGAE